MFPLSVNHLTLKLLHPSLSSTSSSEFPLITSFLLLDIGPNLLPPSLSQFWGFSFQFRVQNLIWDSIFIPALYSVYNLEYVFSMSFFGKMFRHQIFWTDMWYRLICILLLNTCNCLMLIQRYNLQRKNKMTEVDVANHSGCIDYIKYSIRLLEHWDKRFELHSDYNIYPHLFMVHCPVKTETCDRIFELSNESPNKIKLLFKVSIRSRAL